MADFHDQEVDIHEDCENSTLVVDVEGSGMITVPSSAQHYDGSSCAAMSRDNMTGQANLLSFQSRTDLIHAFAFRLADPSGSMTDEEMIGLAGGYDSTWSYYIYRAFLRRVGTSYVMRMRQDDITPTPYSHDTTISLNTWYFVPTFYDADGNLAWQISTQDGTLVDSGSFVSPGAGTAEVFCGTEMAEDYANVVVYYDDFVLDWTSPASNWPLLGWDAAAGLDFPPLFKRAEKAYIRR
jgi:hypothetical protein